MAKFTILLFTLMMSVVGAFFIRTLPKTPGNALSQARSKSVRSFNARSLTVMNAEEYWEGEWVCADCGYIYDKDIDGKYFEQQKAGYRCPQCSAPRKRFAKKVGDKIGVTKDGGDGPIVLFSVLGGLAVIGFGIYAAIGL